MMVPGTHRPMMDHITRRATKYQKRPRSIYISYLNLSYLPLLRMYTVFQKLPVSFIMAFAKHWQHWLSGGKVYRLVHNIHCIYSNKHPYFNKRPPF